MSKAPTAEGVKEAGNPRCCISMTETETFIHDLDNEEKEPKKYTFDYSLWSHDGFVPDNPDDPMSFNRPDATDVYRDQQ